MQCFRIAGPSASLLCRGQCARGARSWRSRCGAVVALVRGSMLERRLPVQDGLSFPLCGEPDTHVPAPMNGLVATVLLQLPFFKHMCGALRSPAACAADRAAMLAFPRRC